MGNQTSLSATELAVCRQMGLTPEEYCQANSIKAQGEHGAIDQAVTSAEKAVCQQLGLTPEAYHQANSANDNPQELEILIAEGLRDGRIAGPQTEAWLRQQGVAACRSHLDALPGASAEALKHGLNDNELAVCRNMGLSPEAYRVANKNR